MGGRERGWEGGKDASHRSPSRISKEPAEMREQARHPPQSTRICTSLLYPRAVPVSLLISVALSSASENTTVRSSSSSTHTFLRERFNSDSSLYIQSRLVINPVLVLSPTAKRKKPFRPASVFGSPLPLPTFLLPPEP